MVQRLDILKETPSQTAGPYVHIGATPNAIDIAGVWQTDLGSVMLTAETTGERIVVKGRVIDGAGRPLTDALVEIWQADAAGLYNSPQEPRGTADRHFVGWGRQAVDRDTGEFCFATIKPGSVPFGDGRLMAPHITVWIVARGINIGLHTRLYFGDEAVANAGDPVLLRIEDRSRIATLVAPKDLSTDPPTYRFDIHLQGPQETVFFDI
ncbi:MAG: protocatechuate 3,4-dioxygenase subunit alpha [Azospirillaceae bacterium]|nr:protocatechuate 3,4-dioxygenase subunit alpha [Azospirillaceae bacterium]